MRFRHLTVGLMAAVVLGPCALGQVLPPPPPPKERKEYVPPPPRPVAPPVQAQRRPPAPQAPRFNVPDLTYVPILKKDDNGKVIRIEKDLDFIAMKHNPMIGPVTVEKIKPVVKEWIEKTEALVLDNVDIVMEVDGGLFERLDFGNEQDVMLANEAFKALFVIGPVTTYLLKAEAIERVQFDFSQKIMQEYKQAVNMELAEYLAAEYGDDRKKIMQAGASHLFTDLCRDALECYRRLLLLTAKHIDAVAPDIAENVAPNVAIESLISAVKSATTDAERLDAMRAVMKALDFDGQQGILMHAIEKRGDPDLSMLEDAAVKPDGAAPQEPGVG